MKKPQTLSSRDLSLGLETSRNPFLQVLASVFVLNLGVLDSWSRSWNLESLGLGLGLGTLESRFWSWDLGPWIK